MSKKAPPELAAAAKLLAIYHFQTGQKVTGMTGARYANCDIYIVSDPAIRAQIRKLLCDSPSIQ